MNSLPAHVRKGHAPALVNSTGKSTFRVNLHGLNDRIFDIAAISINPSFFQRLKLRFGNWAPLKIEVIADGAAAKSEKVWININSASKRLGIPKKHLKEAASQGKQTLAKLLSDHVASLAGGKVRAGQLKMGLRNKTIKWLNAYFESSEFARQKRELSEEQPFIEIEKPIVVYQKQIRLPFKIVATIDEELFVLNDYTPYPLLDRGSFKSVYEIREYQTGEKKVLARANKLPDKPKNELLEEITVHQKFKDAPQIARLIAFVKDRPRDDYQLILDYYPHNLKELSKQDVPLESKCKMLLDICKGIQAMHTENCAHFDIKRQNALAQYSSKHPEKSSAVLCDLGLSLDMTEEKNKMGMWRRGTKSKWPPEIWAIDRGQPSPSPKDAAEAAKAVDLWCLGHLIVNFIHETHPFPSLEEITNPDRNWQRRHNYVKPKDKDSETYALDLLAWELLNPQAARRPAIDTVIERLNLII